MIDDQNFLPVLISPPPTHLCPPLSPAIFIHLQWTFTFRGLHYFSFLSACIYICMHRENRSVYQSLFYYPCLPSLSSLFSFSTSSSKFVSNHLFSRIAWHLFLAERIRFEFLISDHLLEHPRSAGDPRLGAGAERRFPRQGCVCRTATSQPSKNGSVLRGNV